MRELVGTGIALVTPFNKDFTIDIEGLQRVVEYNIENKVDYLVVLGTTAESATLTKSEKQIVIDTVVESNNGRVPLVLGIGGNNTFSVMAEIRSYDLTKFAAILSVSPYYNKPTQEGIYLHFAALSGVSPIPIILYNVPGRTASNVSPETIIRLANDFENIVAVKEAAGDIVQVMRLIAGCPDDFKVISGDDMTALPTILAGGAGVISVIGQGFPSEFTKMVHLGLENDVDAAYKIHYKLAPAIDYIFEEGNPAGIKAVLSKKGICDLIVRLPLLHVTNSLQSKIDTYIEQF